MSKADDALPPGTGVMPLEELVAHSGAELIEAWRAGRIPPPPICAVLDFTLTEGEVGRVVFTGQPSIKFYNPIGTIHGGWISTLMDSCMACAVHTTLEAGEGYTSLELKVNFVKALTLKTGSVRAEGRVTSRGRRIATAEGRLLDAKGNVLALGTTTCLIFPAAEVKAG